MQRRNMRNQVSIVSLLLATALVAPSAFGQPKGAKPAAKAAPSPSGTPGAPSKEDVTKATAAFNQGAKLFQQKKFNLAMEQFKASYAIVPSPNSHLYIARCLNEVGEYKDAFHTFQAVIAEADKRAVTEPKYAPTRDSAKTELDDLSNKIGVLTVVVPTTDPNAQVKLNGAVLPKDQWGVEMPLDPGPVDLSLVVPGQDPIAKKIVLQKGIKQQVTLEKAAGAPSATPVPTAPPPETATSHSGPFIPLAIVFGGVGVLGMATFGVAGGLSKSTYSKLKTACGNTGPCENHTHDSQISKGKSEQTAANVGVTVGAVGLAAGAAFLVTGLVTAKKSSEPPKTGFHIAPEVAPGYAGVNGSF